MPPAHYAEYTSDCYCLLDGPIPVAQTNKGGWKALSPGAVALQCRHAVHITCLERLMAQSRVIAERRHSEADVVCPVCRKLWVKIDPPLPGSAYSKVAVICSIAAILYCSFILRFALHASSGHSFEL